MSVIDVIILVFIIMFALKGSVNGLISEAISVLGIILAILCSYMVYEPIFKLMKSIGFGENAASFAAYILGFLVIYTIVIILGSIINRALDAIRLGWVNRLIGLLFGLLKGATVASIILWIIVYIFPSDVKFVKEIKRSEISQTTMQVVPYLYNKLDEISGIDRFNPFTK